MVRRRKQERSLFEVLLPDRDKLWPAWLRRIDAAQEDEAVMETVAAALGHRFPKSRTRGREGTPAEVVLRMLILKHLHDWSFDDLDQEVRANLVYRAFTRIGVEAVPDAKTILKVRQGLGAGGHHGSASPGGRGREAGGGDARPPRSLRHDGRRDQHYQTDSTLLQDGIRVVTRTLTRASHAIGDRPGRVRNRQRAVSRQCVAIRLQSRSAHTRPALVRSSRGVSPTISAHAPGNLPGRSWFRHFDGGRPHSRRCRRAEDRRFHRQRSLERLA
jgi:IS5 family transposase